MGGLIKNTKRDPKMSTGGSNNSAYQQLLWSGGVRGGRPHSGGAGGELRGLCEPSQLQLSMGGVGGGGTAPYWGMHVEPCRDVGTHRALLGGTHRAP